MRGIVARVWYFEHVKRIFVDISVLLHCYFANVLPIILSIVLLCGGQPFNVTFSFFRDMCIRCPGFLLTRVSCGFVTDVCFRTQLRFSKKLETVGDKKRASSQANKKALTLLMKPASPTPSNTGSPRSYHRDTDRGIKFMRYCEVLQRGGIII